MSGNCHSTHAFCTNRIGLDRVHVCSSTWRPCFVKHRINVQVHIISGVRSGISSSKQAADPHRTLQVKIREFFTSVHQKIQSSTLDRVDRCQFKFQISSFFTFKPGLYPTSNNNHGQIYGSFDGLVDPRWYPQAIQDFQAKVLAHFRRASLRQTRRSKGQTTLAMGRRQRIRDL